MKQHTLQQRIEISKIHYKCGKYFVETVRRIRNEGHSRTAIVNEIRVNRPSYSIKIPVRPCSARSAENFATMTEYSKKQNRGLSVYSNWVSHRPAYIAFCIKILVCMQCELLLYDTDFFCSKLYEMDLNDVYLQQDGTTSHASHKTFTLLREKISGCVFSRNRYINSYLIPLDLFLWERTKTILEQLFTK